MAARRLAWTALTLVAVGGWYLTATRLTFRLGPDEAAPAVGLLVAVAVGVTVWRWGREDRAGAALASGRCPRCDEPVALRHEHGRGGQDGVGTWGCSACGYEHTERLTCERCRP